MKTLHITRRILALASVALLAATASAQTTSSGYFLEGFNQRYQLNPAFAPERDLYISIPALNNVNIGFNANVGVENFIFKSKSHPGKYTTFMSADVNRKDFLDRLPETALFNGQVNMDLLSVGIGGENGYTIGTLKLRHNEDFGIPKSFFGFMKSAFSDGTYNIQNVSLNATTYLELAVVHSRRIGDNLRVGLGLKFLDGIEYANINIDDIDATIGEDAWKVRTNGSLKICAPGQEIRYNAADKSIDFGDYNYQTPSSFGFAVDMGAEYDMKDVLEGLRLSASITDLGAISWNNIRTFATDNKEYVTFSGFNDYDVMNEANNTEADRLGDDFKALVNLYDKGEGSEGIGLGGTFRTGAIYQFPFAKWLYAGELITLHLGNSDYFETRTSVRLSPKPWFDFTANAGYTSWGGTFGAMINLHPRNFNFFLAIDGMAATVNKQNIPVDDFNINLSLGMSLAFGDSKAR